MTEKQIRTMFQRCKEIAPKMKLDLDNTAFVCKALGVRFCNRRRMIDGYDSFFSVGFKNPKGSVHYIEFHDKIRRFKLVWDCGGAGRPDGFSNNIRKEKYFSTFLCTTQAYATRRLFY